MKNVLLGLLLIISMSNCSSSSEEKGNNTLSDSLKSTTEKTEKQDSQFPRASHIFWIDLDKSKSYNGKTMRNVKVKAMIDNEGKVKVTKYEKKQSILVTNKIEKCLQTFRVKPEWLESGKVKIGEQIIFLRFIDAY